MHCNAHRVHHDSHLVHHDAHLVHHDADLVYHDPHLMHHNSHLVHYSGCGEIRHAHTLLWTTRPTTKGAPRQRNAIATVQITQISPHVIIFTKLSQYFERILNDGFRFDADGVLNIEKIRIITNS